MLVNHGDGMKNEMDEILRQFFVTQKIVESFLSERGIRFRVGFVVNAEVDELHQDAFLDDGNVLRRKHVGSKKYMLTCHFFTKGKKKITV